MALKLMSWNVEHADRLVVANPSATVLNRQQRVRATVEEVNPDILCIDEGPRSEAGMTTFSSQCWFRSGHPDCRRPGWRLRHRRLTVDLVPRRAVALVIMMT